MCATEPGARRVVVVRMPSPVFLDVIRELVTTQQTVTAFAEARGLDAGRLLDVVRVADHSQAIRYLDDRCHADDGYEAALVGHLDRALKLPASVTVAQLHDAAHGPPTLREVVGYATTRPEKTEGETADVFGRDVEDVRRVFRALAIRKVIRPDGDGYWSPTSKYHAADPEIDDLAFDAFVVALKRSA